MKLPIRLPRATLWRLGAVLVALLLVPVLVYHLFPTAGVTTAAAAGVGVIVAVGHLGVLAVLVASLWARLRGRSRR